MLNKLQKIKKEKSANGFTIIEVMIVLAIAGLIILIVFLAVPALQRNSRNTAIKNDASAVSAGVTEFLSNNDGKVPVATSSSSSNGTVTINNASGTEATAKVQPGTTVNFADGPSAVTPVAGVITVQFKSKCPASVSGTSVTPTTNARSTAVVYAVETASSQAAKCVDS